MNPTPTFYLRVTFTGLCLFVHDTRDAANPAMDVLLIDPSRLPAPMEGMDPHRAVLYYDSAYRVPSSDRPAGTPRSVDVSGDFDLVRLDAGAPGTIGVGPLPAAVVDVDALTGDTVDPDWLTMACGGPLRGRVRLGVGCVADFDASGPWKVNGEVRYMAWRVSWFKPVFGAAQLTLPDPAGTVLHPTSDRMMNLSIKNVVDAEQHFDDPPYQLPYAGSQRHFMAYSQMLKHKTAVSVPTPVLPAPSPRSRGSLITCGVAAGAVG